MEGVNKKRRRENGILNIDHTQIYGAFVTASDNANLNSDSIASISPLNCFNYLTFSILELHAN